MESSENSDMNKSEQNPAAGMQQMLEEAQRMQQQMLQAQEQLSDAWVEGSAGGGVVRAKVSGTGVLQDLRISPAVINPNDPQTLIQLILDAVHDADANATQLQERVLSEMAPGLSQAFGMSEDEDNDDFSFDFDEDDELLTGPAADSPAPEQPKDSSEGKPENKPE